MYQVNCFTESESDNKPPDIYLISFAWCVCACGLATSLGNLRWADPTLVIMKIYTSFRVKRNEKVSALEMRPDLWWGHWQTGQWSTNPAGISIVCTIPRGIAQHVLRAADTMTSSPRGRRWGRRNASQSGCDKWYLFWYYYSTICVTCAGYVNCVCVIWCINGVGLTDSRSYLTASRLMLSDVRCPSTPATRPQRGA